jgi:hypothetical protein
LFHNTFLWASSKVIYDLTHYYLIVFFFLSAGIEYLYENHLLRTDPKDVAQFLYKGEGLNKTAIGEYWVQIKYIRLCQNNAPKAIKLSVKYEIVILENDIIFCSILGTKFYK